MKARLITNGIFSLIATFAYSLLTILVWRADFSSGVVFTIVIMSLSLVVSIFVSFIMGIITLSMEKHESARGLTIASGVIGILAILYIPIVANWIVSFIGVYKINKAKKEIIEEQKTATNKQTGQTASEKLPST